MLSFDGIGIRFINQNHTIFTMPALSELKEISLRLQKKLEEELENIRAFKNGCVKDQTFELAAPARDLEKKLLAFRKSLGS